jgi:RNA polymerase sigma-70 factor, ECF subfamily
MLIQADPADCRARHDRDWQILGIRGRGDVIGSQDSFVELEARLRAGDQGAASEVFRRFARRLIGLARAELDRRLQCKEDPEDIVQSVYRSFFTRHRAGQFDLRNWDSLWTLLTVITVRKCCNRSDYYLAKCRNVASEVAPSSRGEDLAGLSEAIDREPTPLEAAILAETIERLMRGLDGDERAIIELRLQGYSVPEIGERLGRAERTVRRICEYFKVRLRRMQAEAASAP